MAEKPATRAPCQIYLISPPVFDAAEFATLLEAALTAAPIAAFQLRLKEHSDDTIAALAPPLQQLCVEHDTAFIINDSVALAERLQADGVHLGQGDGDPRTARAVLGDAAQIGVTCHNSRDLALLAGEAGADYVAFGAFYASTTKQAAYRADVDILQWWQRNCTIPCVAIGGVTIANAPILANAGADFVALSNAIWRDTSDAHEVAKRTSALHTALSKPHHEPL